MNNPIIKAWNEATDGKTKEDFVRFLVASSKCVLLRELLKELDGGCGCKK